MSIADTIFTNGDIITMSEASPSAEDPLVGRTLPGGYRVTHLVGVGGMGRVYCAEQVALGRTVAVKVVHPHLADDELAAARFLNEARTASWVVSGARFGSTFCTSDALMRANC